MIMKITRKDLRKLILEQIDDTVTQLGQGNSVLSIRLLSMGLGFFIDGDPVRGGKPGVDDLYNKISKHYDKFIENPEQKENEDAFKYFVKSLGIGRILDEHFYFWDPSDEPTVMAKVINILISHNESINMADTHPDKLFYKEFPVDVYVELFKVRKHYYQRPDDDFER